VATAAGGRGGTVICPDCYRRPTRACGRCGRVRVIVRLARDGDPDLCNLCWTGPTVTCESCGKVRPCRGERRQKMLCISCGPVAPQTCAHCGRLQRQAARWVEGPLCQQCYGRALAAKATCPGCGTWRRLRLHPGGTEKVCSDCAGAEPYSTCQTCGIEDCLYDKGRCARCALNVRLTAIFGGPDQPGPLRAVRAALSTLEHPESVIRWLLRSDVTAILRRFADGELPVTFEAVDGLPRGRANWFVEHLFTTAGVLAGRDPVLARFELWVVDYLDTIDVADHERVIRRYSTWEILRRARAASARRPLSDNAHNSAKTKLKAAHQFLLFLATRGRGIGDCRQGDLDAWGAAGPASRCGAARGFFAWATRQHLAPTQLDYPPPMPRGDPNVVFSDGEWALARHLLHAADVDTADRVAGLLVVLYAQNATRISQLTTRHVTVTDAGVTLRLGVTPIRLPPPMDDHVTALLPRRPQTTAAKLAGTVEWLFPGHQPGRHTHPITLSKRLRDVGVYTSTARTAALAHLAATMPAAIVADLLGISPQTATAWADAAARSRADYADHR